MKLLVLFFSGTVDTEYVTRYLARHLTGALRDLPVGIELRSIEWQAAEDVGDFDLLALGFPVYAGDAPGLVQEYLEELPPGRRRAFVSAPREW